MQYFLLPHSKPIFLIKKFDAMKAVYFSHYIPHYRKEIFIKLNKILLGNFSIYASSKPRSAFTLLDKNAPSINFIESKINSLKIFNKKIFFQKDIIKMILNNEFDIYMLSLMPSDLSVWLGLFFGKIFNRRVILWGHGYKPYQKKSYSLVRKIMIRLSSASIFYSKNAVNYYKKSIQSDKLFYSNNAVNTQEIFEAKQSMTPEMLAQFQIDSGLYDKELIIYSGRLDVSKNLGLLLKALVLIKMIIPKIYLIIIGDGIQKSELLKLSQDLDLTGSIDFVGQLYDENELSKYFMSAKIFIIPSAVGLSIHHAFNYSLPVITDNDFKRHGPEIELLVEDFNGYYYDKGNSTELSNKIMKIIANDAIRSNLSKNAFELIKNKYNPELVADKFYSAFRAVYKK